MNASYLGYLLLFGAAAGACLAGAYRTRTIPARSVRRSLAALLLTTATWAGAYVGVLLAPTVGLATTFHLVGLVAGAVAVGTWLWFCSAYAGRELHRDPAARRAGLLVLAFVVLTKLTNPWHELYFTAAPAEVPFPHLALDYHLLYWASVGLAYALAAVGYFILYDLFKNVGSGGGALGPLAGLTALPILFNALGSASPSLLNISHEPLGVAVFAIGVFSLYGEEFRAVRFAGEQEAPAFVLDDDGRLQEYNRSAQSLLPDDTDETSILGTPIGEILPSVEDALATDNPSLRFGDGPSVRYYQIETDSSVPGTGLPGHFLVLEEVTEHKMRETVLEEERTALRQMSRVTADPEASFEQKIARLLDLGRTYLDLSHGYLAEVSGETKRIVSASGPTPLVEVGETYPISDLYCGRTIRNDGPVATRHVSARPEHTSRGQAPARGSEIAPDTDALATPETDAGADANAVDETHPFASYIGAKVMVAGDLYGTFCFGSPTPRAHAFSERETAFVELLARWTSYEIERRRDRRRLEQQNERLEQFSSVLTHDLRNPLNVAQGRVTLAREEMAAMDPTADLGLLPDHLHSAAQALDRMERLITDMLTLTWGEQGFGAEDMETVSLRALAEGCWEQVEAPEATLRLDGDRTFSAHKGRLQQFLENLFRNAVEHGGPAVTVTVGPLPDGFFVADDGPGIPADRREKVFERGFSSEDEGTGLGLSIAQAIAEAHGWTLSVTDGRDGGARFEVRGVAGRDAE